MNCVCSRARFLARRRSLELPGLYRMWTTRAHRVSQRCGALPLWDCLFAAHFHFVSACSFLVCLVVLYNVLTLLSLQKTSGAATEDAGGGQEKKTIRGAETEAAAAQQCQTQGESLSTVRSSLVSPARLDSVPLLCRVQTGEKSRDDALEAIKGNLDGFSRDAKMHPTPSSQTKKPGRASA